LALYPATLVGAFVIGEGLVTLQTDDTRDPTFWEALLAVVPALLVFVVPGVLAVYFGRNAVRLGRPDGTAPAVVGAVIGLGFVALNLMSYVAGLMLDRASPVPTTRSPLRPPT
jgi:hypothetical protein